MRLVACRREQPVALDVDDVGNLRAPLGDLVDNVRIVFYIIERDQKYSFYVLDRVHALLPRLRFGIPQILGHLL